MTSLSISWGGLVDTVRGLPDKDDAMAEVKDDGFGEMLRDALTADLRRALAGLLPLHPKT